MSKLKEVEEAINILKKRGISEKSIALLHCTTEYPAPLDSITIPLPRPPSPPSSARAAGRSSSRG